MYRETRRKGKIKKVYLTYVQGNIISNDNHEMFSSQKHFEDCQKLLHRNDSLLFNFKIHLKLSRAYLFK